MKLPQVRSGSFGRKKNVWPALVALIAGLTACAAPPAGSGSSSEAATPRPSRPLVIALRLEPTILAAKGLVAPGTTFTTIFRMFNAGIAYQDERGAFHPELAESLPVVNTESWRILPDGQMETTYQLKPNLRWHDGTPLSAEDFVFALRVFSSPELGRASSSPQNLMREITAPDPRTVVIGWRRPYADADALLAGSFAPLPRHILQDPLVQNNPEAFVAHPYWTREYVGLGPYRLDSWEPGAFLEARGFDEFVLGRPKIDRIKVIFVGDPNTVVANLLARAADMTTDDAIRFPQAANLRREWEARGDGVVLVFPNSLRRTEIQHHPDRAAPRALLDVRVRRAVMHAVDRDELNQSLIEGVGVVAHTLALPDLEQFTDIDRATVKYPYDPRRTEQLLSEVGFTKGADGLFTNPTAGRLTLELRVLASSQNEQEQAIMADSFKRAGLDVTSFIMPAAAASDGQLRASFPALSTTTAGTLDGLSSEAIPTAENHWQGGNRGSWRNADYDRLVGAYNTAVSRSERGQHLVRMARIFSQEIPNIPLYYNVSITAHGSALQGPIGGSLWNLHLWGFREAPRDV